MLRQALPFIAVAWAVVFIVAIIIGPLVRWNWCVQDGGDDKLLCQRKALLGPLATPNERKYFEDGWPSLAESLTLIMLYQFWIRLYDQLAMLVVMATTGLELWFGDEEDDLDPRTVRFAPGSSIPEVSTQARGFRAVLQAIHGLLQVTARILPAFEVLRTDVVASLLTLGRAGLVRQSWAEDVAKSISRETPSRLSGLCPPLERQSCPAQTS
jgi:hypothetical protein